MTPIMINPREALDIFHAIMYNIICSRVHRGMV